MQWWCSALGVPWDWRWQPYPGVWLFLLTLVAIGAWLWRGATPAGTDESRSERTVRRLSFASGILLLWAALDWPIGPLGAGYLASVHMVQYLLIALLAPPFLLLGIPPQGYARLIQRPWAHRLLRALTVPPFTLLGFLTVAGLTHVPWVSDRLMVSQVGSFAIDMAWFVSAILFWWPVIVPLPVRPRFHPPVQLLYLFPTTLVHSGIAAFLVFSRYPVYATYELAPPTGWVSAVGDQQIAGGLMWLSSTPFILSVMGIVFFRWHAKEEEAERGSSWLSPSRRTMLPPRAGA